MTNAVHPKAKKSLGQHFLRHRHMAEKIVTLLCPTATDNIIEIGPGPGILTQILEETPLNTLLLVEKDKYWAAERQRQGGIHTQAILMDALCMDWKRITTERPWKIVGNLPYNVASPLMWDIFSQATGLVRAVFMVQKEVGLRLAGKPHTKEYGALSVWTQSFMQVSWGFTVGPGAFSPPPKVDSAVLAFTPLPLEARPQQPKALARLIKMCFQNRRKQLGSIFRQHKANAHMHALEVLGIDPTRRPENLSPQNFQEILQASETYSLTL